MLVGKRLRLRAIEEDDLELIARWRVGPGVYDFFHEFEPLSRRHQKEWFESQFQDKSQKNLLIETHEGQTIGMISLFRIDYRNRKAEWGRFLIADESMRGKGYGREALSLIIEYAFDHLNLQKLYCEAIATNAFVVDFYKRLSFVVEGTLKNHVFKGGEYRDVVLLALFREQYVLVKVRP